MQCFFEYYYVSFGDSQVSRHFNSLDSVKRFVRRHSISKYEVHAVFYNDVLLDL